ncbi:unnamed protein product [Effrenium voratum]|uniref:Uncharacterized protein n=1 Tax=Effrenium voratum TaxID=2562239 RepID=A0AA36N5C7_9DINO|nr:unnamed protein product [Effrenium voratum]CAJ1429068.1 unnamed protein product [Effrenium voratum]
MQVPDHRRYARGGSFWVLQWLEAEGGLALSPLLASLRLALSLADGEGQASNAFLAFDVVGEWLDTTRGLRGLQGLFMARALLAENLCIALSSSSSEVGVLSGVCAAPPSDADGCRPGAAKALLELGGAESAPMLAIAAEMMRGCAQAPGAAAWRAFWHRLARSERCVGSVTASRRGEWQLCEALPRAESRDVEIHVLGASADFANGCLFVEVVMHVAAKDGCYVTQAGSNLRTLPQSFTRIWYGKLGEGPPVTCAAASAFGTDVVVHCSFADFGEERVLYLEAGDWQGLAIPLCRPIALERRRLTVCSGVMFNAGQEIPGLFPPLLEQWLAYHEELGVDHFALYDSDGSAHFAARPRQQRGQVSYFPNWPQSLSAKLGAISRQSHCRHCLSALAEAHCLWSQRGRSDWVLTLHSFDAFLAPARSLHLDLAPLRDIADVGTVPLAMVDFGGAPQNSSWLIERFQLRAAQRVLVLADIGRGNPREDCWLNHPGSTLKNPERVWGVYDHYARSVPGSVDVENAQLRVNHYVDIFGERCSSRFLHCEVPDTEMLWILPKLRAKYGK